MPNVKTIITALEASYLANGQYPVDEASGLDISIQGCVAISGTFRCSKEFYDYYAGSHLAGTHPVGGFPNGRAVAYIQYPSMGEPAHKRGTQECWAETGNASAAQVCKSMGGVAGGTSTWNRPTGTWTIYPLP